MGTGVGNVTVPLQTYHLRVMVFRQKCLNGSSAVHPAIGVMTHFTMATVKAGLIAIRAGQRTLTA